jgi:hypothetical protein
MRKTISLVMQKYSHKWMDLAGQTLRKRPESLLRGVAQRHCLERGKPSDLGIKSS